MLFNSFQFVFFFAAIVPLFYLTPYRYRWVPLLLGSYYFYMCWNPAYIILILASTAVDYFVAGRMAGPLVFPSPRSSPPIVPLRGRREEATTADDGRMTNEVSTRVRTTCLIASLVVNLGLLFSFKYFNFFVSSVTQLLDGLQISYQLPRSELLLPVGISFYTFQTLSYTIDVYRGRIQPERHLGKFALYVAFFPQLVAGPIERAERLLPQFSQRQHFDIDRVVSGLRLMLWGLFKKVVIADRLAEYVNRVYSDPSSHSGATLLLATYFFAFQIYCDFSGYSDIAIGTARVLGFRLMQNFNLPYLATNIADFWRRWHISLSTWFRDYVYIPLGGSHTPIRLIWARNIFIVFVVSGLWHGANWTFAIWGLLHAIYFLIDAATRTWRAELCQTFRIPDGVAKLAGVVVTFHLVVLAWVFFRANTVADATMIVSRILLNPLGRPYLGPSQLTTAISALLILLLVSVQWLQAIQRLPFYQNRRPVGWYVRWPAYVGLILAIAMLGKTSSDFIYFQF